MAVEVRIPTILRTYTGGEKAVSGEGATLSEVIENLEANHPGLKERLIEGEDLRRFVNVYVNDEDVRFTGGLETKVNDGDQVVVAGRDLVAHPGLHHRQRQPVPRLEVAVAQALGADELVAHRLEEPEVVGVVDDAHLIGVAVDDAQLHRDHG